MLYTHRYFYLNQFLLTQIPFLNAIVTGTAEQDVAVYGKALNPIIMRGLKVMSRSNVALGALCHIKYLP